MNQNFMKTIIAIFLGIFLSAPLFSQSTDIVYKSKGKNSYSVRVFFSDKKGGDQVNPDDFRAGEQVFFTIVPTELSEREYFKSSDLEDYFFQIRLMQEGNILTPAAAPAPLTSQDGKIMKYVLTYPKAQLVLFKEFSFISPVDTSEAIKLTDEYYNQFKHYKTIYEEGYNLSHDRKFVESFNVLYPVVQAAEIVEEVKYYTFYNHLSDILMERAIRGHADSLAKVYLIHSNRFRKDYAYSELLLCDSVQSKLEKDFVVFEPYMKLDFPKCASLRADYERMKKEMNTVKAENFDLFKQKKLSFFQNSNYGDFKFGFYLDVIARLVTYRETFVKMNGLDVIDLKLLSKMPDKKTKLEITDWLSDFTIIVNLINDDIKQHHYIFSDSVMSNLFNLHDRHPQPYYEIFRAFNTLSRDPETFRYNLNEALLHCSDSFLIENLEKWMLCSMITDETTSPKLLENINNGIKLINTKKWKEAAQVFDIITMQASSLAMPWYYSGLIAWENDEKHVAQNRFDMALSQYPNYIAPRIYIFNDLYEKSDYDQLLAKINLAIESQNLWIYQFWKAKTLYAKKQYKEAITCIKDNCMPLNVFEVEAWFLLGDIYYDMKDPKSAREAYQQTQVINPYDYEKYNRIMTEKF